jgi:hypothetical protein
MVYLLSEMGFAVQPKRIRRPFRLRNKETLYRKVLEVHQIICKTEPPRK